MLILREESPRSLRSCLDEIARQLDQIGSSGEDRPRYLLTILHAQLRFSSWESLMDDGLHAWLQRFLGELALIADSIHHTYLEAK